MTTSGFVWRESADWQSVGRWENEGGSYDPFTGDALERHLIIREGFNRWFDPWLKQFVFPYGHPGYIAGWCMDVTYFAAYQAGLRGDPTWLGAEKSVEAIGAVASAAGCSRHAVLPSDRADEIKQISLRREPRPHVARDRDDRGLDGNTAEGRHGWLGPASCGQKLPARAGRRGANLYGRAQEHRQGGPGDCITPSAPGKP
jgi:hypothetical protein